uniref:Uncharacterized protein n=1 Tax=Romanomermis culicivorax TaxID=13658 RepID=A0A915K920_ROMCU
MKEETQDEDIPDLESNDNEGQVMRITEMDEETFIWTKWGPGCENALTNFLSRSDEKEKPKSKQEKSSKEEIDGNLKIEAKCMAVTRAMTRQMLEPMMQEIFIDPPPLTQQEMVQIPEELKKESELFSLELIKKQRRLDSKLMDIFKNIAENKSFVAKRIPQDQEQFRLQERAPQMSNQELVMQLRELKGTIEVLFDIIANAATEYNKREADSHQQEQDRQDNHDNFQQNSDYNEFLGFKKQKELQKQYQQMQQYQQQAALQSPQPTQAITGPTQTLQQRQFTNQISSLRRIILV